MTDTSTRQVLERQIEVIRTKLRGISPELMRELEATEMAVANLSPDYRSTEYAKYKTGVDAVKAFLEKNGRTATGEVIAKAVINGEWLAGHKRAEANLLQSIFFHAINNPDKTKTIRRFGGGDTPRSAEIGLYSWDDSYRAPR